MGSGDPSGDEERPQPAVAATTPDPGLMIEVAAWLASDPDPGTRAELGNLVEEQAWEELAERFSGRLAFGTAGLRAQMGAGPMRMNRLVVRSAAAGLMGFLRDRGHPAPLVVVGFDARHRSDVFAADSAAVIAEAGGRAVVFDVAGPTPLLAFAVRHLGADAGVMVTASHNPPADNGYKVYLADGAQLVPPIDLEVAAHIAAAGLDVPLAAPGHPAIAVMDESVRRAYLEAVVGQLSPGGARQVRVAYTPLHGVGATTATEAFAAAGFPALHIVADQADPDPTFPTVAFPNPEEPGALDRGLALAAAVGADVLLANDPDADRLGVAVPDGSSGWRVLTGDEIGVLLADHLLRHRDRDGERLVVTTLVSSRLLGRLAEARGIHYAETLTGFKWIVRPVLEHPAWRFVLGYEEALGFAVGSAVRDKDGIAAALAFAELVAESQVDGVGVLERLELLARELGLYATVGYSLRFGSSAGAAEQAAAMQRARSVPPVMLGGVAVSARRDLLEQPPTGDADAAGRAGSAARADVVVWELADSSRVVLRPSGTEPKLKVYLEVVEPVAPTPEGYRSARLAADRRLAALRSDLDELLLPG